jgi:alpha-maltose-1-phosphate synthase
MRVAHLLRKYNPAEWGGTETSLQRLFQGLDPREVAPVIFCPRIKEIKSPDLFADEGYAIRRFRACVPVLGISKEQKRQMVAVGGNLLSFDLPYSLWREPELDIIHSHAQGRIGGVGLTVAKQRRLPFVVTIHGGALDLPPILKMRFHEESIGWDWGKVFGALFDSRQVLEKADAILVCNPREAALLKAKYSKNRIQVQAHGVDTAQYQKDCRDNARAAFPIIQQHTVVLCVGRIDRVKNQHWLVEQLPQILKKHPSALLVLAGACTNWEYEQKLKRAIEKWGLQKRVLLTGGFALGDPRLIGLVQESAVVLLSSLSETFGLVLIEAWAAGKPVISSRTSGAAALIQDGQNGWLYDLDDPHPFHAALDKMLTDREYARRLGTAGCDLAHNRYDIRILARQVKNLYQELIDEKNALRHSARR